jgi:hypothetical protein
VKNQVLYYLAFPNDRLGTKCLVYGIYILDVVQTALVVEIGFQIFITNFGDVQVFDRVLEMAWLVPILTALGKLSRIEQEQLMSNIPLRSIICAGILCSSDPHFGTIQESGGNNYCCKFSKVVYYM